jgi:hypothetical protein
MIRVLALALIVTAPVLVAEEPPVDQIIRRSLELDSRNYQLSKDYTYEFKETVTEVDRSGKPGKTRIRLYDVLILYGHPYSRLIGKEGAPLSESERRKEEDRLRKEMEKRRRAAEDPVSKEREEFEKRRARQRQFLNEIPSAFDFRLLGEENVGGHPAWLLQAEPRPGFQPKDSRAKMFSKLHGRIWIDKNEYQWVKVEAETTGTISFGLFLARLSPSSTLSFEQTRVNDEVWLPSHAGVAIEGRLALVKKLRLGVDVSYSNYRKFQTDSKVISTEPLP